MFSLRLSALLLTLLFLAHAPAALAGGPPSLTCPQATGREATIVLDLPADVLLPPQGGWIVVSTPAVACVGQATWHPALRTLTIHGDDPFTPAVDGARPGDALQLHFYGDAPASITLTPVLDDVTCVTCSADLVYEHDGLYVVSQIEIGATTDVGPGLAITQPAVRAPYPNPTRDASTLEVALPATERVRIVLFDVLGREVRRVHDDVLPAGVSQTQIETMGLASGSYLLRVSGETFSDTRSLVVVE